MMNKTDDVRFLKPTAQIWSDAIVFLEKTVKTPGKMAWLHLSQLIKFDNGEAVIAVMNDLGRTMIVNHMADKVEEALSNVTGVAVRIKVVIDSSIKPGEYIPSLGAIDSETPVHQPISNDAPVHQLIQRQQVVPNQKPHPHLTDIESESVSESVSNGYSFSPEHSSIKKAARVAIPPQIGRTDRQASSAPTVNRQSHSSSSTSTVSRQTGSIPLAGSQSQGQLTVQAMAPPDQNLSMRHGLNPRYSFSTFVIGSNNRFCQSAAFAVSQRPGQTYNPLFIYGGVGLGKTHLMHAIAHQILSQSPNLNVKYINCERFTNELINSIRDGRMVDFRKRYRHLDVLLVDDIQFIEGKESTQEEFFHTFNALKESGKQIVLSSDRPPKALSHLEERLKSRFEWGLISDIQAPDFETRLAILRKKCDLDGTSIDSSTLEHIASVFTRNVRELEGALIRVNAFVSFTGEHVDQLSLHNLLTPRGTPAPHQALTVETVIATVAQHFKVEPVELKSAKRSQDLTLPRHMAMYLAYEMMNLSFPRIGQAFGNRKHTSALYAHGRIREMIEKEPATAAIVAAIKRQLGH